MRSGDQLQGKVALITGGGGEIGGAIARQFALQGASVMLAELRPEAAAATVADIAAAGGKAASVICDVARETDAGRAVAETVAAFGRLDILVNTAAAVRVACSSDCRMPSLVSLPLSTPMMKAPTAPTAPASVGIKNPP